MSKLALTLFAAGAIAAPALTKTPLVFTWQDHKIVGTVDQVGDTQLIEGHDLTTGRTFELRVKNDYVRGEVGGVRVSFPAPKAKLAAAGAS